MRHVLIGLGWIALCVGAFGVLIRSLELHNQRLVMICSAAPYLMAAGLVAVVVLGVTRHWIGFAVSLVVAVAAVVGQAPLFVPDGAPAEGGTELTVMQANIWLGNADADALVEQIVTEEVDVVTINELTPDAIVRLTTAGIADELPYSFARPFSGGAGTGIWSRYPLSEEVHYEEFLLSALSARIALPDERSAEVYAFHPVPPWPTPVSVWAGEMDRISAILNEIPADSGPVIVSGDFNATRDHLKYRNLVSGRFRDAADQAGSGVQNTYPADQAPLPPMIAIDHIASSDAHARSVDAVTIEGSDHRGLIARLVLDDVDGRTAAERCR
ncbi:MAG: endonuclease/exonuclease/phosphatase family protein [Rhodococcus sp.]|nr:endonuclease/exonuclease/phosphatase family protein [Rhodococcus sp. (in: high G+C Gram-positive bacteria)]